MFRIRKWERFQFMIDFDSQQVFILKVYWCQILNCSVGNPLLGATSTYNVICMYRANQYFSEPYQIPWNYWLLKRLKTNFFQRFFLGSSLFITSNHNLLVTYFSVTCYIQIMFLVGLKAMGEIRTLFSAEVLFPTLILILSQLCL